MPEKKEEQNLSHEKQHYDTLISIFKYMVGAITILTGFVVWIIGGSLSDTKKDISEELQQLKTQINTTRQSSQDAVKEIGSAADNQIEHLRKNTESFLNMTKDITAMQISTLREDAKNLALSSSRERIEEAFKANAIQNQVELAAKKEIGDRLNNIVNREIEKTSRIFDDFPILTSAYDRLRFGERSALDILDSLANHSDNPTIRRVAQGYLLQKGIDYEQSIYIEIDKDKVTPTSLLAQVDIKIGPIATIADSTKLISDLVKIILKDTDLYKVTIAFVALKKLTKNDIKMFDLNAIRKLYNVK